MAVQGCRCPVLLDAHQPGTTTGGRNGRRRRIRRAIRGGCSGNGRTRAGRRLLRARMRLASCFGASLLTPCPRRGRRASRGGCLSRGGGASGGRCGGIALGRAGRGLATAGCLGLDGCGGRIGGAFISCRRRLATRAGRAGSGLAPTAWGAAAFVRPGRIALGRCGSIAHGRQGRSTGRTATAFLRSALRGVPFRGVSLGAMPLGRFLVRGARTVGGVLCAGLGHSLQTRTGCTRRAEVHHVAPTGRCGRPLGCMTALGGSLTFLT